MANVLFAGQLCALLLPLMIFHQLQLMVCAVVARSYAAPSVTPPTAKQAGVAADRAATGWGPSSMRRRGGRSGLAYQPILQQARTLE